MEHKLDNYDEEKSLLNENGLTVAQSIAKQGYDPDKSLLNSPEEIQDSYDENVTLLEFQKPLLGQGYDESASLLNQPDSIVLTSYNESEDLLDRAVTRIDRFLFDVGQLYKNEALARIEYYKLKALNLVTKFAEKAFVEDPREIIRQVLGTGRSTYQPPTLDTTSRGYTDEKPYLGQERNTPLEDLQQSKYKMGLIHNGVSNTWTRSNPHTSADDQQAIVKPEFNFSIRNMASNVIEYFPAHIQALNESSTPSWNSVSLINRSEDIYIYNKSDRGFNLDFWLLATQEEIDGEDVPENYTIFTSNGSATLEAIGKKELWKKMNFLQTLSRPKYDNNVYVKAPFCKLWIGDLFKNFDCIIEGINFNYDPMIWDVGSDDVKPMIVQINMAGKILHESPPSVDTKFYK
jgi:hypothetical protein